QSTAPQTLASPIRAAAPPPRSPLRAATAPRALLPVVSREVGRCTDRADIAARSRSLLHPLLPRSHRLRALHHLHPTLCSACGQRTTAGEGGGPILAGGEGATQRGAPGRPQHDGSSAGSSLGRQRGILPARATQRAPLRGCSQLARQRSLAKRPEGCNLGHVRQRSIEGATLTRPANEVVYNTETGQRCGFSFITMSIIEEADKAIEMFNHNMP
ncbi:unnamed protein product, partial [Urochloa humidicola]